MFGVLPLLIVEVHEECQHCTSILMTQRTVFYSTVLISNWLRVFIHLGGKEELDLLQIFKGLAVEGCYWCWC